MNYGIVVIENVFGTWKNMWKFLNTSILEQIKQQRSM